MLQKGWKEKVTESGHGGTGDATTSDITTENASSIYSKVKVSDTFIAITKIVNFKNIQFHFNFKEDIVPKGKRVDIALLLKLTQRSKVIFDGDIVATIYDKIEIYSGDPTKGARPTQYVFELILKTPKAIQFFNEADDPIE